VTPNDYLNGLLTTYAVNAEGAKAAGNSIYPLLEKWGNGNLNTAEFSGSLAKGTGVSVSTDADIFLSLNSTTPGTLEEMYLTLGNAVKAAGYPVRKQDVSIGTTVNGYAIDLVPARRQSQYGNDHSLYRNKTGSWTQTNVATHISHVTSSNRTNEIRLLKLWRIRHALVISSFYLELTVIDALRYARHGEISANFLAVLEHLRDKINVVKYVDPANTNNVISDDCTSTEKLAIAAKARSSLGMKTWQEIVW
jgi:hypothetical protein